MGRNKFTISIVAFSGENKMVKASISISPRSQVFLVERGLQMCCPGTVGPQQRWREARAQKLCSTSQIKPTPNSPRCF